MLQIALYLINKGNLNEVITLIISIKVHPNIRSFYVFTDGVF